MNQIINERVYKKNIVSIILSVNVLPPNFRVSLILDGIRKTIIQ